MRKKFIKNSEFIILENILIENKKIKRINKNKIKIKSKNNK